MGVQEKTLLRVGAVHTWALWTLSTPFSLTSSRPQLGFCLQNHTAQDPHLEAIRALEDTCSMWTRFWFS